MGQSLLQLGDHLTAERFLRRALEVNASYAPAYLHLGWVYLLSGDPGRAYDQFQHARALDPNSPTAEQAGRLLQNYFP
jgi:tetratricopeptide (TPR) repeat protein